MSDTIIEVDGVSKLYRLGDINTGTLSEDLNHWWARLRGRQKDYANLTDGDEALSQHASQIWSLRDISFSVNRGEVFGIIGKNGAGKSTMLKLLSRITKPTRGSIRLDGRIASLLEVGTGFHPDLTGRENVYLNGAILGMRRKEIARRFDEIVAFSGVERFIDTPVKRYSSGMFVRLAFAVAAHLEPEILIIDEVLAVGDAEFQEKCLGKMQDVSRNQGRTVLFVSHNVAAVRQLCNRALLLEKGRTKMVGNVSEVLEQYQTVEDNGENGFRSMPPEQIPAFFKQWRIEESEASDGHSCYGGETVLVDFHCFVRRPLVKCEFHLLLKTEAEIHLFHASSLDFGGQLFVLESGHHRLGFRLPLPLHHGKYILQVGLISEGKMIDSWLSNTKLVVMDRFERDPHHQIPGLLNLRTSFCMGRPVSERDLLNFPAAKPSALQN